MLSNHAVINTTFKTKEGNTIYLRKTSETTVQQQTIYRAVGLSFHPIKTEKTFAKKDVVPKVYK